MNQIKSRQANQDKQIAREKNMPNHRLHCQPDRSVPHWHELALTCN